MPRWRRRRRGGVGGSDLATVATTLAPTADLIQETARDLGRTVTVDAELIEGAYAALINGDQARHDALVQEALARSAQSNEVVVLAQASMARVAKRLDASAGEKILSSPPFAVEDVARRLGHS